ncbi:alpha-hydroxy acid oxidase [Beijerinckia indica]|uniref:FMN-dependent alpha-hydroxy acid dehydrogenase n=1 Tax=Beijerinckia indica subsp. indica (strain ATCC 9039 / DSM 1715 / NCIMB 8712) TaxID=395963 RepID=B2IIZ7_BEII9|nr:alpha-hydroxy acid oxidase [Beijerinckia indica]ACB96208.1 FMN-dependent alpha-hydroxy acid dehydrogenase [Beijerinckia indica subsp. indica ATCC 9039]
MFKSSLQKVPRIEDLALITRRRVPKITLGYLESGTGEEVALRRNREALDRVLLVPHYLKSVGARSTQTRLFGRTYDLPIGISPVGLANAIWPGIDKMLAEAARNANVPYGLSTVGTTRLETISEIAPEHLWFQLYVAQKDEVTFDLLQRAHQAGVDVLLVTVDVPISSKRVRDIRNGFQLPLRPSPTMALDLALHPAWLFASARAGMPRFETLEKYGPPGAGAPSLAAYVADHITDQLGPDLMRRIRDAWPGKLVIKGIMSVGAAEEAAEIGADGIVVSNHGGRQFDAAPAAIEVLPEIAAAVGARLSVMMDSGVRSGEDVLRAVSLGAEFVFSGRSFVYGAAAAGPAGAAHALQIFKDDILRGMAQLGITDLTQMRPSRIEDAATCTSEQKGLQAGS